MDNTLELSTIRPTISLRLGQFFGLLRRLVLLGVDFYLLGFCFYFISRVIHEFWFVSFISLFLQYLLLPVFVVLPLTLFGKSKLRIGAAAILCMIYVASYGALFLPDRSQAAPDGASTLKVIAFNSATTRTTPFHLDELLLEENADIVGIIEVSRRNKAYIQANYRQMYPYQIFTEIGTEPKALLSRYPIESYDTFILETTRANIEATININGKRVTVYVVHPPSPDLDRELTFFEPDVDNLPEVKGLLERADSDQPTLLLGDFNFTDQHKAHDLVEDAGFTDMHRAVGYGFGHTWGHRDAAFLVRIDYVWVSSHFLPLESRVGADTFGDHRPVIARIAWK